MGPEQQFLEIATHLQDKYPQLKEVSSIDLAYDIQSKVQEIMDREDAQG